ncbi:hypothetical protein IRJ41_011480 [Triplophysa rosa]|uniref:C2 domain-containing protein n=1 Tax=Triplophysa rosa TaxID=992332 RepID=A0A9W7T5K0_TRIRA|nr:hypothetical protein IRJ41_011480 [Triplophysa rosa]
MSSHVDVGSTFGVYQCCSLQTYEPTNSQNKADAYVKVWCNDVFGGMTEHRPDQNNPWWSAELNFPNCKVDNTLKLEVWDKDLFFDDKMFACTGKLKSGTYDVTCIASKGTLYYKYRVY